MSFSDDLEFHVTRLRDSVAGYLSRVDRGKFATSASDQKLVVAAIQDCRAKVESLATQPAPVPTAASAVAITTAPFTIAALGTKQCVAVVTDADGNVRLGRLVTWNSATPAHSTVDANGLVTGVATGTSNITATCEGVTSSAVVATVS